MRCAAGPLCDGHRTPRSLRPRRAGSIAPAAAATRHATPRRATDGPIAPTRGGRRCGPRSARRARAPPMRRVRRRPRGGTRRAAGRAPAAPTPPAPPGPTRRIEPRPPHEAGPAEQAAQSAARCRPAPPAGGERTLPAPTHAARACSRDLPATARVTPFRGAVPPARRGAACRPRRDRAGSGRHASPVRPATSG